MSEDELPAAPAPETPAEPPRLEVAQLMGEGREAILIHNGESYRLRVTNSNKLILTK